MFLSVLCIQCTSILLSSTLRRQAVLCCMLTVRHVHWPSAFVVTQLCFEMSGLFIQCTSQLWSSALCYQPLSTEMFLGFVLLASLYRDVPRLCVVNHSLLKCSKTRYIIVHMNTFVKFIARIVHLPFIYLPFMPFLLFLPNYLKSVTIVFVIL